MLSNWIISLIRTYVPVGVGLLVTWAATQLKIGGLDPSTKAALAALMVAIVTSLYYTVVRLLEHWKPQLGWLLGVPAKPNYAKAPGTP